MLNNSSETLAKWAAVVGVFAMITMIGGGVTGLFLLFSSPIIGIVVIATSVISGLFILLFANLINAISETLRLTTEIRKDQKAIRAMLERQAGSTAGNRGESTSNASAPRSIFPRTPNTARSTSGASSSGGKDWYCSCGALNPANASECQNCFARKS